MTSRLWLIGTIAFACGCESQPPAAVSPVPVAKAVPTTDSSTDRPTVTTEANEKLIAGVTVTIPAGWEERIPASDIIQAEYQLSGDAGPARLTMSSTGGGVEANIARWHSQFVRGADDPAPEQSNISVDGQEAIVLELSGTFNDGMPGSSPKTKWSLFGAVIPTGPATFFVKLTGPRDTVGDRRDEFMQLVRSARLPR